jgi:hypothetical protein
MKYVVTSRVALLLPLTSAMPPLSRCLLCGTEKVLKNHGQKKTQKSFKPTLFVQFSLGGLKNSTTIKGFFQ